MTTFRAQGAVEISTAAVRDVALIPSMVMAASEGSTECVSTDLDQRDCAGAGGIEEPCLGVAGRLLDLLGDIRRDK
jgi:hypothetical protein